MRETLITNAKLIILVFISILYNNAYSRNGEHQPADSIHIEAMLLNNPSSHLYHQLPYRTFDWKSNPSIELSVRSAHSALNDQVISIRIFNKSNDQIYNSIDTIKSVSNTISLTKDLEEVLIDPDYFEVALMKDGAVLLTKNIPISLVKFYGNVTDFEGNPIQNAWIITLGHPFQIVTNDENGYFEMYLPKGNYNCIAAMTNKYPAEELENYIWNLPLHDDFQYDFKIGKAEVFRLMADAMPQNRVISGSFVAWSCSGIKKWMDSQTEEKYVQGYELFQEEFLPDLKKEDVRFFIDDIEIKEIPLFEKANILVSKDAVFNAGYHFEFLIPRNIPKCDYHTLRVEISYPTKDNKGVLIIEKGQASLHNITIY